MQTVKEQVQGLIQELPDEASFEDIHYHIYVRQKILRGLEDAREGRVVSQEEARRRMAQWLAP